MSKHDDETIWDDPYDAEFEEMHKSIGPEYVEQIGVPGRKQGRRGTDLTLWEAIPWGKCLTISHDDFKRERGVRPWQKFESVVMRLSEGTINMDNFGRHDVFDRDGFPINCKYGYDAVCNERQRKERGNWAWGEWTSAGIRVWKGRRFDGLPKKFVDQCKHNRY